MYLGLRKRRFSGYAEAGFLRPGWSPPVPVSLFRLRELARTENSSQRESAAPILAWNVRVTGNAVGPGATKNAFLYRLLSDRRDGAHPQGPSCTRVFCAAAIKNDGARSEQRASLDKCREKKESNATAKVRVDEATDLKCKGRGWAEESCPKGAAALPARRTEGRTEAREEGNPSSNIFSNTGS